MCSAGGFWDHSFDTMFLAGFLTENTKICGNQTFINFHQMRWMEQIEKHDDQQSPKSAAKMRHKRDLMQIQESRTTIRVPAYTDHDGE